MSLLQYTLLLFMVILINVSNTSIITTEPTTTQSIYAGAAAEILKLENDLKRDEEQLRIDRENFEEEKKQMQKTINNKDVFQLNVGGEIMMTTRQTLARVPKSILSILFNGRWEQKLQNDQNGNIFFDFYPIVFPYLIDQLQLNDVDNLNHLSLPSEPSLVTPFKKMIRKLDLNHLLSLEKNIFTFNVGGQIMTNQRTTFNQISNSTLNINISSTKTPNLNDKSDLFIDSNPKFFRQLINQFQDESLKNKSYFNVSSDQEKASLPTRVNNSNISQQVIAATHITNITKWKQNGVTIAGGNEKGNQSNQLYDPYEQVISAPHITNTTKWKQNGITIAGGNVKGNQSNQLHWPQGIYVDDEEQCIYIADNINHRITAWKYGAKTGQVVAGGNGQGNQMNQLYRPTDVIVDKRNDSLIICDWGNDRVVRWPRQNPTNGQTIISNIDCWGLTMDNNGDLYISDTAKDEVRRWKAGETRGTIVAGGNGEGKHLNQLYNPTYIFVDEDHSVYVSDWENHRVMKWVKGAKEGIVVAGGQGYGKNLTQLYYPHGVIVDHWGNVYVTDYYNSRIMRWSPGSSEGSIVVGGNEEGQQPNQLNYPADISFDRQGNLYVVDWDNHRVQKFDIDSI